MPHKEDMHQFESTYIRETGGPGITCSQTNKSSLAVCLWGGTADPLTATVTVMSTAASSGTKGPDAWNSAILQK